MLTNVIETDAVICEGKTKIGRVAATAETERPLIVFEAKEAITANNDPSMTKQLSSKPAAATTTTCRVFELFHNANIPTAYFGQLTNTKFVAYSCQMIPLECIVRRYAVGSMLKRYPDLKTHVQTQPHAFHPLCTEFFLKTSNGSFCDKGGKTVDMGFTRSGPLLADPDLDDPFILNPDDETWVLRHPKKPIDHPAGAIEKTITASSVLPAGVTIGRLEHIMSRAFLCLEDAWLRLNCRLIDFKIEFGVLSDGGLVIADVIDNDSWRLWDKDGREMSKELFRQGGEMGDVQQAYERVAELAQQLT